MYGRKVFSNENRLLRVGAWVSVAWTLCCVLLLVIGIRDFDAERKQLVPGTRSLIESKSELLLVGLIAWGGGVGLIGGGCALFWRVSYRIDYEGSVIAVQYSWPRKQLFVDDELQDQHGDFAFERVDLHGRIKSGQATGKPIRVSCTFGTYSPVCMNIDDRIIFQG